MQRRHRLGSRPIAERYALDNLVVIVDKNNLQQLCWADEVTGGRRQPYTDAAMRDRWTAFGFEVIDVDGHDMAAVVDALNAARAVTGKPAALIAHTVKGKGVSFMEGDFRWHSRVPTDVELATALAELADPMGPDTES